MRNKRKYIRTTGIILLFCAVLLNMACTSKQKEKVVIELKQGLLSLIPLNQNAVRVQFSQPGSAPLSIQKNFLFLNLKLQRISNIYEGKSIVISL
jgi:hypothetical protein